MMKVFYIVLFLLPLWSYAEDDVIFLQSSAEKLVIQYRPQFLNTTSLLYHHAFFFETANCSYRAIPEKHTLPVRQVILQMPEQARVAVRTEVGRRTFVAMKEVAIASEIRDSLATACIDAGDLESETPLFKDPAVLGRLAWIQRRPVRSLWLFPVLFDPRLGGFWLNQEITVSIEMIFQQTSDPDGGAGGMRVVSCPSTILMNLPAAGVGQSLQSVSSPASALFSGAKWFRMTIQEEGIYRLDYQTLLAAGIQPADLSPDHLHIYYGGGDELNPRLDSTDPGMVEIPSDFDDRNGNTVFDSEDGLLFYAQSVSGWRYKDGRWRHVMNHYNRTNCYWLCLKEGPRKQMGLRSPAQKGSQPLPSVCVYRDRIFQETERTLINDSGVEWMWETISQPGSRSISFSLADSSTADSARLSWRIQGLSENHHLFQLSLNDHPLSSYDLGYTLGLTSTVTFDGQMLRPVNRLGIKLFSQNSAIGFDWFELVYGRRLYAVDKQIIFYSTGYQGWTRFLVSGFIGQPPLIFDITHPTQVTKLKGSLDDFAQGLVAVVDSLDSARENRYLALTPDRFLSVTDLSSVPYDLDTHLKAASHQADYLIITHPSLLGPALEKFVAHRSRCSYWSDKVHPSIMAVTTQQIYDQFSSGLVDPVAIRNFLKWSLVHWQQPPLYVLMVGAPTYDFKDHLSLGRPLLVPSFEIGNSVSDDWFVQLTNDRHMDMIIGRFPVDSEEELAVLVDKIVQYDEEAPLGNWRSRLILAADDVFRKQDQYAEDFIFLRDSEVLANDPASDDFDLVKIYLADYPWDRTFNKPLAQQALVNAFQQGALFINFFGHANWNMLTHESLLRTPLHLPDLRNRDRLPVLYAGTCEIARIDDPHFDAMAEALLLYPEGGTIACIGSARWNMHQASFNVSRAFYKNLFTPSLRGGLTIGQALTAAKITAGFPDQTETMFLLGDPALKMPIPTHQLLCQVQPDTLSATRRISISGSIMNNAGRDTTFYGFCELRLYDSAVIKKNLLYTYSAPGRLVYQGTPAIVQGRLQTDFFTQSDTLHGGCFAKLVAYACQRKESGTDRLLQAVGAMDSLCMLNHISTASTERDTVGPEMDILVAGRSTEPGLSDVSLTTPVLLSGRLSDMASGFALPVQEPNGFMLKIDEQTLENFPQKANIQFVDAGLKQFDFFYELSHLELGRHHFKLMAADRALNRSYWELDVEVVPADLTLESVLNYPNPVSDHTVFTFTLSREAFIQIKIYTVTGRCIRKLDGHGQQGFNQFPPEGWDGRDEEGDFVANGVYLYKVIADAVYSPYLIGSKRVHTEQVGKLIIAR